MSTLNEISTSKYLTGEINRWPDLGELVGSDDKLLRQRQDLCEDLVAQLSLARDEETAMRVLRMFKRRETFCVAQADYLDAIPLRQVLSRLTELAEVIVEGALQTAIRLLGEERGFPLRPDGTRARIVVIGLGALGGEELSYSGDLALMFLSDPAEKTDGNRSISAHDYFDRLSRSVLRLLSESTDDGLAYNIDTRLRSHGPTGPAVSNLRDAVRWYELSGRTWDRLALVKARPIAGDTSVGAEFLDSLSSWIYRRYLNRADIAGIRHIKRRIEKRAQQVGEESRNVANGRGGTGDIEFSMQFLQLLNGGDLQPVRTSNTLAAIKALEQVGCLSPQESAILNENYVFLRGVQHHSQIMFGLDTRTIPEDKETLATFCPTIGHQYFDGKTVEAFEKRFAEAQSVNRRVLNHLLHDAFGDEDEVPMETELVLDPMPSQDQIHAALARYGFSNVGHAYKCLQELADEKIPFLSQRRCRHFLAAIAPRLLQAVSETPDPMATLENMVRISDSLGGKSALWELASFTPATLEMVVRLSAVGPYLVGILTSNPGMIDELMDSLILDRLPGRDELEDLAAELCRGAEDVVRILFSVRNSVHLRVGVRDILGKDDIQATHRALADCAEICLQTIIREQYELLANRFGDAKTHDGQPCELVVVAIGKLGGQDPNYHSNLELMYLYTGEGHTQPRRGSRSEGTTNNHFFNQLGQRIAQVVNRVSPQGRLYHLDTPLRPSGGSSIVAVPAAQLGRYFQSDSATIGQRLALCKSRPIYGTEHAKGTAEETIREVIRNSRQIESLGKQVYELRMAIQDGAATTNLKRGIGGTLDVEFAVAMLQLRHASDHPEVVVPGTLDAIERLRQAGQLMDEAADQLSDGYAFLRRVESGLRLLNTTARHDLPTGSEQLEKLVYLLRLSSAEKLTEQCQLHQKAIRAIFESLCSDVDATS